jgi:hypothetical protein
MGTCYTYLLYDECDWHYVDKGKEYTIEAIKKELPVADVLATWPCFIVIDMDKHSPWRDSTQLLQKYCDGAWYYTDTAIYELHKVRFKQLPVDKEIEDNKPANRNKDNIEKAYKSWLERYKSKEK